MKEKYETLATIVVDTASEIGINVEAQNILSSSDQDTRQLSKFVVATCEELLTRFPWKRKLGDDPWVKDSNGDFKDSLEYDDDIPLIDSRLLKLGTRWRYLHSKGFNYAEDFRAYELRRSSFAYDFNKDRPVDLLNEPVKGIML